MARSHFASKSRSKESPVLANSDMFDPMLWSLEESFYRTLVYSTRVIREASCSRVVSHLSQSWLEVLSSSRHREIPDSTISQNVIQTRKRRYHVFPNRIPTTRSDLCVM